MKVKYLDENIDTTIKVKVLHRDSNHALLVIPPGEKYECYAIVIAHEIDGVWQNVHDKAYVNFEKEH